MGKWSHTFLLRYGANSDEAVVSSANSYATFHEPVQSLIEGENVELYLVGSVNTILNQLRSYPWGILEIDKESLHSALRLNEVERCLTIRDAF